MSGAGLAVNEMGRHSGSQERCNEINDRDEHQSSNRTAKQKALTAAQRCRCGRRLAMPQPDHVLQLAAKQKGVDQQEHQRCTNAGNQQQQGQGQGRTIAGQGTDDAPQAEGKFPVPAQLARRCGRGGVMLCFDSRDNLIREQLQHGKGNDPPKDDPCQEHAGKSQQTSQSLASVKAGIVQSGSAKRLIDQPQPGGPQNQENQNRGRQTFKPDPQQARLGQIDKGEGEGVHHCGDGLLLPTGLSTWPCLPCAEGTARRGASRCKQPESSFMSEPATDVIAIGNAIVDVMAPCDDALIEQLGMTRGGMTLVDAARAHALYEAMGPAREISGGSAANTLAGLAALGANCAFIGQVANDQLGEVFAHDIRAAGIDFATRARVGDPPTARCLIFVTPDGQRTMNTFLGASQYLPERALDEAAIAAAKVLYLEGYLWDPEEPRAAMRRAIAAARGAGRKVAFTLSDAFVIDRHGDDFRSLIDAGEIDILFANHIELAALTGKDDFHDGIAALKGKVPTLVVTRSADGAVAVSNDELAEVRAEPIKRVIDTTGAGDLFAAGFLFGHVRGRTLADCLRLGAICAAEIISHYGARPEVDLKALVAQQLD